MKTVQTKIELPDKIELGGGIENVASRLIFHRTSQGIIEDARIEMDLQVIVEILGDDIEFNSTISRALTTEQMTNLMIKTKCLK